MKNSGPSKRKIDSNGNNKRLNESLPKCGTLKYGNEKFKKALSFPSKDKWIGVMEE